VIDLSHWFITQKKHKKNVANKQQQGVCGLAICIKNYLKAKKRIMKTQIFHHAKI